MLYTGIERDSLSRFESNERIIVISTLVKSFCSIHNNSQDNWFILYVLLLVDIIMHACIQSLRRLIQILFNRNSPSKRLLYNSEKPHQEVLFENTHVSELTVHLHSLCTCLRDGIFSNAQHVLSTFQLYCV